jgi:hypothetical protein
MRSVVLRVAAAGVLAGAVLLALLVAFPGRRSALVSAYELVLGAMAVAAILASLRELGPGKWEARSPFERPPEKPPRPEPIAELDRIDRVLVLAASSPFDVHHRLRPLLRELTSERLHAHHGIELDRDPEQARQLLGDELWELARPGRELLLRSGPGLPLADSTRLVQALERL